MFAVARDQAMLKEQAGNDARGRKNRKPVLHYTLSWAASDNPSPEHMRETARSSLEALGLSGHQVLMAAHGDKQHLHVHLVVNTIHPDTGLTAPLKYTKERLSRWAEAYERAHGIHCEERIRNNAKRDRAARERAEVADALLMCGDAKDGSARRPPYVPVKYRGPNRRQWFSQKELKDRMSRLRAELDLVHKVERQDVRHRQQQARADLDQDSQAAVEQARTHIKARFKGPWQELYRVQKREMKHVQRDARTVFERAVFVFSQRERLGHGKPLTVRQMLPLIRNEGKLVDRLEAVHLRERRALAQVEKVETKALTDRIWIQHRVKFERLKAEQAAERQAMRDEHFAGSRSISLTVAKASLVADLQNEASNDDIAGRAIQIRQRMAKWRRGNQGRDFGREM